MPDDSRSKGLLERELTQSIIGGFFAVDTILGFGFMEHVYRNVLAVELRSRGHQVAREVLVPVYYRGVVATHQRLDLIVDQRVVVEIKTGERLHPIALKQLQNYLRCTDLEVGLLLYFGHEAKVHRVIHTRDRKFHHSA